jgi:hypothetical protein
MGFLSGRSVFARLRLRSLGRSDEPAQDIAAGARKDAFGAGWRFRAEMAVRELQLERQYVAQVQDFVRDFNVADLPRLH